MQSLFRGKKRETGADEVGSIRHQEQTAVGDERASPYERAVVAARHFEHREAPEAPATVAELAAPTQMVVGQRLGTQADEDEDFRDGFVPQDERLGHPLGTENQPGAGGGSFDIIGRQDVLVDRHGDRG